MRFRPSTTTPWWSSGHPPPNQDGVQAIHGCTRMEFRPPSSKPGWSSGHPDLHQDGVQDIHRHTRIQSNHATSHQDTVHAVHCHISIHQGTTKAMNRHQRAHYMRFTTTLRYSTDHLPSEQCRVVASHSHTTMCTLKVIRRHARIQHGPSTGTLWCFIIYPPGYSTRHPPHTQIQQEATPGCSAGHPVTPGWIRDHPLPRMSPRYRAAHLSPHHNIYRAIHCHTWSPTHPTTLPGYGPVIQRHNRTQNMQSTATLACITSHLPPHQHTGDAIYHDTRIQEKPSTATPGYSGIHPPTPAYRRSDPPSHRYTIKAIYHHTRMSLKSSTTTPGCR